MCAQDMNQNAIDTLFAAADREQKFAAVNFQNRRSLTPEQMLLLVTINQGFGRGLSARLAAWMDVEVKVAMIAAERVVFRELLETIDHSMYIAEGNFASSSSLICLDLTFVSSIVNLTLGGTPRVSASSPTRDLTAIDSKVMDIFLSTIWSELNQIWDTYGLHAEHKCERSLANVGKVFAQTEYLLVFTYEMKIGDIEGVLQIGLSATVGDALLRELDRREPVRNHSPETQYMLQERLGNTKHKLYLRSPTFTVSIAQILGLSTDTVLTSPLSESVSAAFGILGGKTWKANLGQRDGRIVARISK